MQIFENLKRVVIDKGSCVNFLQTKTLKGVNRVQFIKNIECIIS